MIRRPPRSTRTDTLFPYTTLFRSDINGGSNISFTAPTSDQITASPGTYNNISSEFGGVLIFEDKATSVAGKDSRINGNATLHLGGAIYMPNQDMEMTGNASPSTQCLLLIKSEERRVGKECGSTCRSRWSQDH